MNQLVNTPIASFIGCRFYRLIQPNIIATRSLSLTQTKLASNDDSQADFKPSEELAKERYDSRSDEPLDKKRARLLYQSRKRGMLENGVILASFADKFLNSLNPEQLDQYDRLINLPTNDWDIFYWATKTKPTPVEFETPVMEKLRAHLRSKVSKDSDGKTRGTSNDMSNDMVKKGQNEMKHPRDLMMPAIKSYYDLEPDISETSLTNYADELFDTRTKTYPRGISIQRMTDWRKKYFLRRINRTISSPVSLRNMSDDKKVEVYTQKTDDKPMAKDMLSRDDLIDSHYNEGMKHHNLLQHLMRSDFTDDARDYDDEAEAWAKIIWHRNYGSEDVTIAPSSIRCVSCSEELHCCDRGLNGYLPKEIFATLSNIPRPSASIKCQRCQFAEVYDINLGVDVSEEKYVEAMKKMADVPPSIICLVVDLTDFPSGIMEGIVDLIGTHHKIFVVGNKLDLLPYDAPYMIERVTESLKGCMSILRPGKSNLYLRNVMVLSARTGFGVEALIARILSFSKDTPMNVYLIGSSNSGKSTLFNALLQSDLSAIREGDLINRVSSYRFPPPRPPMTGASCDASWNLLRFPVAQPEGWEIVLKSRRLERVERNTAVRERSFKNTTKNRQATTSHMSMLIDRLEFPPKLIEGHDKQQDKQLKSRTLTDEHDDVRMIVQQKLHSDNRELKFTVDHPLHEDKLTCDTSENHEDPYYEDVYLHQTPSFSYKNQIHDLLTNNEKLIVFPHETIVPRRYSLRPLQSIFIAGLARVDLVTANSHVTFTIFASKYLPIHVIPTRKADQFYKNFLGTPYLGVPNANDREDNRLADWPQLTTSKPDFHIKGIGQDIGSADIVLSSVGWAMVNLVQDQECKVRAFTPGGRGIFIRRQPLLPYAAKLVKGKIRDTPLFKNPNFSTQRLSIN